MWQDSVFAVAKPHERTRAAAGLKKVLGETEDILSQRQDFWTNYKSKYFPDGDWGKTEFVTEGLDYNTFKNSNPAIYNEMAAKYGSSEIAEEYLPGLIESGSSIPTKVILNKGDELYKIVPSGSDISGLSPYYLSKAELNFVKQNPEKLEQVLGLPLSSCSGKYEVYKIVAKENNLAVFEANIAPTKQYLKSNPSDFYSTTGGRKQTLLIDNGDTDLWEKSSSAIETIEPTVLPVIE